MQKISALNLGEQQKMTHSNQNPSNWTILFLCWLVAGVSAMGSLFFSYIMGFAPCVLCWYQRIFLFPLVIILTVGLCCKICAAFSNSRLADGIISQLTVCRNHTGKHSTMQSGSFMYWRIHRALRFSVNTNAFFAFIFNNYSHFNYLKQEDI